MEEIKDKSLIISDGCCVQYGDALALDDVTFTITEGKLVAVVGPNGGGKSTLFNAMAGLIPLSHGSMKIKGLEPDDARSYIGYVPQNNQINWNFPLTVRQVVEMGLIKRNTLNIFSNQKNNQLIEDSLSKVGLLDRVEENINNLSSGQLQRVLLARTLTQGADILLLDEAFSAVDIGAEIDLMKIINDIKEDGKTILIATHDIQNIEDRFDEVLCLNRHCCAFGEPSEVLTEDIIEEMYGSHNQILKGHILGNHGANSGD